LHSIELVEDLLTRLAAFRHFDDSMQVPCGAMQTPDDLSLRIVTHKSPQWKRVEEDDEEQAHSERTIPVTAEIVFAPALQGKARSSHPAHE
jgi:hypothetical protein